MGYGSYRVNELTKDYGKRAGGHGVRSLKVGLMTRKIMKVSVIGVGSQRVGSD